MNIAYFFVYIITPFLDLLAPIIIHLPLSYMVAIIAKNDILEVDHIYKNGADWDSIKADYADYKLGAIDRKELVKRGLKLLGKRFMKKILSKVM